MDFILVLVVLTSLKGQPDVILPVPEESFNSASACQLRREFLLLKYPLEEGEFALCLKKDDIKAPTN